MTEKLFGAISLCRKAGKLVMGADACERAVREGKAKAVLLCRDLSERSAGRMRTLCSQKKTAVVELPCDMESLAPYLGKPYGILAACDNGFVKLIGSAVHARHD